MKAGRISKLSAYARAESHPVQRTGYGGVGEPSGSQVLQAIRLHPPRRYQLDHPNAVTACGCLLALVLFWAEMHAFFGPAKLRTVSLRASGHGVTTAFSVDNITPATGAWSGSVARRDPENEF